MADEATYVLGISAFYHDSAAALLRDGRVIAAAQEERFTRRKGDASFPSNAVGWCLAEAGIDRERLDHVAFYEKPWLHFERLLETHLAYAPRGLRTFLRAMPVWLRGKLFMARRIRQDLGRDGPVLFCEHHEAHMAAAFLPSPFERAAVLTVDGVGEWATTAWGRGEGHRVSGEAEIHFPHSLGLLYSAFTHYLGFRVNSGEYKVMGLAPYGQPRYADRILEELIDLREDGSYRLNMDYLPYPVSDAMTGERFAALWGAPRRTPGSPLEQLHMDLARSVQAVVEEAMLRMARHVHRETGERNLVLGGGVALNCVANGRLVREGPFDDLWIQPAAGDAGSALGAALAAWHHYLDRPRRADGDHDAQRGSYLGPAFGFDEVRALLDRVGARYRALTEGAIPDAVAERIADGGVVGLFQGPMEFGPRALGHRSIVADPRDLGMQRKVNEKIKFRESFRPFAPAVLREAVGDWFAHDGPSPYMLLVAPVHPSRMRRLTPEEESREGLARLRVARSEIPAVTHVDGSARLQTVDGEHSPRFRAILESFERRTGCPVVLNTSFNVRGEPIVCTPADAWRCFMRTDMDHLLLGDALLHKSEQPADVEVPEHEPETPEHERDAGVPEARRFAALLVVALAGWAAWGAWRPGDAWTTPEVAALAVASALVVLAVAAPRTLLVPRRLWIGLGEVLGRVTTPIVLSLFYFAVLTPTGLARRLLGGDPMGRRGRRTSYWRGRDSDPRGRERYEQPF
ncbi:MAG: SxtJ family membrane protein [Myxococcota bacterium]